MDKEEIKYEINRVLDQLPNKVLEQVLFYVNQVYASAGKTSNAFHLNKILEEDGGLLEKLVQ